MKKILTYFCLFYWLLFSTQLFAGDELRAGHITMTQITTTTVEAKVVLVVEGHADLSDLSLCWGDGTCSNFPVLSGVVNTGWNIKTYQISVMHSYPEINTFTARIDHCCFDALIYNMTTPENSNFYIETMIVLQEGLLNSTPDYPGNNMFANVAQVPQTAVGAVADPEGDTYVSELCIPVYAEMYVYPPEFFPSSPLYIYPGTGSVLWEASFFNGIYTVQTCTEEWRAGAMISSSQRVICFMVGTEYATSVVSLQQAGLSLYPNPVLNDKLYISSNGRNKTLEGAKIKFFNSTLQEIYQGTWNTADDQFVIPTENLSSGHYFFLLETKTGNVFYEQIVVGE